MLFIYSNSQRLPMPAPCSRLSPYSHCHKAAVVWFGFASPPSLESWCVVTLHRGASRLVAVQPKQSQGQERRVRRISELISLYSSGRSKGEGGQWFSRTCCIGQARTRRGGEGRHRSGAAGPVQYPGLQMLEHFGVPGALGGCMSTG